MSLIASARGVALLPCHAETFLPTAVTTRPLDGEGPKIDLSVGYRKANPLPFLKLFLSGVNELTAKIRRPRTAELGNERGGHRAADLLRVISTSG